MPRPRERERIYRDQIHEDIQWDSLANDLRGPNEGAAAGPHEGLHEAAG